MPCIEEWLRDITDVFHEIHLNKTKHTVDLTCYTGVTGENHSIFRKHWQSSETSRDHTQKCHCIMENQAIAYGNSNIQRFKTETECSSHWCFHKTKCSQKSKLSSGFVKQNQEFPSQAIVWTEHITISKIQLLYIYLAVDPPWFDLHNLPLETDLPTVSTSLLTALQKSFVLFI